jgi:hypothetical protein
MDVRTLLRRTAFRLQARCSHAPAPRPRAAGASSPTTPSCSHVAPHTPCSVALDKDAPAALKNHDKIEMGSTVLVVKLVQAAAQAAASEGPSATAAAAAVADEVL